MHLGGCCGRAKDVDSGGPKRYSSHLPIILKQNFQTPNPVVKAEPFAGPRAARAAAAEKTQKIQHIHSNPVNPQHQHSDYTCSDNPREHTREKMKKTCNVAGQRWELFEAASCDKRDRDQQVQKALSSRPSI